MLAPQTIVAVVISSLALSGCHPKPATSGSLTDADRAEIRSKVADFDKAMLAADVPAIVSVYTEDAVIYPPNVPEVRGRAAIQKFFEGSPKMSVFKQTVTEVGGSGDLAYPLGTYETTVTPPGAKAPMQDRGKVLSVWQRQPDGSWRAARVMWNSDLAATR